MALIDTFRSGDIVSLTFAFNVLDIDSASYTVRDSAGTTIVDEEPLDIAEGQMSIPVVISAEHNQLIEKERDLRYVIVKATAGGLTHEERQMYVLLNSFELSVPAQSFATVTITSAQGVNLIDVAKELVLTPQDATDYVLTIPKAATAGNFTMTYQSDDVRVFSVEFSAYPDDAGVLGKMSLPKPVESVTLTPSSPTVKVGAKVQLSATFTPVDATNKTGVWSSDATDKATVDQNGLVTGKAVGSANITFTTNDGAKKATKAVSVTAAS